MKNLTIIGVLLVGYATIATAHDYHFDINFLDAQVKQNDIDLLEQGLQKPGIYRMDILLNGVMVDSQDITLQIINMPDGSRKLQPNLSATQLLKWGVKENSWVRLKKTNNDTKFIRIADIPYAKVTVDVGSMQLLLDIPQAYLKQNYSELAPEELLDNGINAFLMNYSAGTSHLIGTSSKQYSSWAQLQPGFNFGAWRLRSSFDWYKGNNVQRAYSYAERGLSRLKSRLTLGERTTPGDVFDGIPFTGVMLATDEDMVPASERNFSPVISGVAYTHAQVEVRQHGYLLKTLQVAPGPFNIQDIPSTSGDGSDLQVIVKEADGRRQLFSVPWQTPAIALHTGYLKYSLVGGNYRSSDNKTLHTPLVEATAMYGLQHGLTIYGGTQYTNHYNGISLGIGTSLGKLGAISTDETVARSKIMGREWETGTSWRIRYSSHITPTNTNFSLMSTQYASSSFRTITETLNTRKEINDSYTLVQGYRMRGRNTFSVNQSIGPLGSLGLNMTRTDWRNRKIHDVGYGASWHTSLKSASLSLNWQKSRLNSGYRDNTLSLWLSLPIGGTTNASWSMSAPNHGPQSQVIGLDGNSMEERLNWDVREQYVNNVLATKRNSESLHLGWNGSYGDAEVNYGQSPSEKNIGGSISGGMIFHRNGLTLSQPLNETTALIKAPGASGMKVSGWPGIKIDKHGYTMVSNLSSYRQNIISLDPSSEPDDVEITQTDVKVIPTKGAVVLAKFPSKTGARALVTIHHTDGSPVQFATQVKVEGIDGSAGMVGSEGQSYLVGLPSSGTLQVNEGAIICRAVYNLPSEKNEAGLYVFNAVCK